jgi:hypothetical protein
VVFHYTPGVNTRTALIALVIALVAAAAAYLLLRPKPAPAPPVSTWVGAIDPALVEKITVEWKGGQKAVIEKSPMAEVWLLRQADWAWPVGARRIGAIARLMADIDAAPETDAASTDAATVTFRVGGQDRVLSVSGAQLAGRAIVRLHGQPDSYRTVDAQIARLFEPAGLRAWRETGAFQSEEFSRIRLQTVGRQIIVARVGGRWGVQVPVVAPADQESCAALAAQLPRIELARFIDEAPGDEQSMGLANPEALIDTETDFRTVVDGDVQRRVLIQQLKIGGPIDPAGQQHYASLRAQWLDPTSRTTTPAWGPVLAVVRRGQVDGLSAELLRYVARTTIQTVSTDVATMTITRDADVLKDAPPSAAKPALHVEIVRYLDTWRLAPPGSIPRGLSKTEEAGVEYLLQTLCDLPASGVGREMPAGTSPIVRIKVEATGAGEDVGVGVVSLAPPAEVGKPKPDPQPAVVLRVGGIYRVYFQKPAVDAARWLNDLLPPEG